MCRYMPILQLQIYHPVAEIETKCPGRVHKDGSWQSWHSNAAQTPEWAKAGDIVQKLKTSTKVSLQATEHKLKSWRKLDWQTF